jgi:hypothetical protein
MIGVAPIEYLRTTDADTKEILARRCRRWVKGYVAFWRGVKVEALQAHRPEPVRHRGGNRRGGIDAPRRLLAEGLFQFRGALVAGDEQAGDRGR